jgi:hypothetical protein
MIESMALDSWLTSEDSECQCRQQWIFRHHCLEVAHLTAPGDLFILMALRRFDISLRAHNKYG